MIDLLVLDVFGGEHDGGDEEAVHIGGAEAEVRVEVAESVDVDVGHHVHGGPRLGVPEYSLEIGLHCHVWRFNAIENTGFGFGFGFGSGVPG